MKYLGLRTYNGKFVCAERGGGGEVNATRTDLLQWETFEVEEVAGAAVQNGSKVHLRTYDGMHYLCAENGGGAEVNATRTTPAEWETFTLEIVGGGVLKHHSQIRFRTYDGKHYLCAEGGGGGMVNATRTAPGGWETFTIETVRMLAITGDTPDTMREYVFA